MFTTNNYMQIHFLVIKYNCIFQNKIFTKSSFYQSGNSAPWRFLKPRDGL